MPPTSRRKGPRFGVADPYGKYPKASGLIETPKRDGILCNYRAEVGEIRLLRHQIEQKIPLTMPRLPTVHHMTVV